MLRSWLKPIVITALLAFPATALAAPATISVSPVIIAVPAARTSTAAHAATVTKGRHTTREHKIVLGVARKTAFPVVPLSIPLVPTPPKESPPAKHHPVPMAWRAYRMDPIERVERQIDRQDAVINRAESERHEIRAEEGEHLRADRW